MVTPEIIQEQETAEQNEQPVLKIENDARSSDDSESESQQKGGLNSEMLRSLDQAQTAATPVQNSMQQQKQNVLKLIDDRNRELQNNQLLTTNISTQQTTDIDDDQQQSKFTRLTYRGKKLQKNSANITTVNEQVALYNYRKKYPALRLQFKINYIVYRREGWFLMQENPAVLPQLCRTNKRYYAGSLRVLAQFYKQTAFCLDYRQACLGRKQESR